MTNKPIEKFQAGNVEVAVWENRGEDSKVFHSVTAKRTYVDGSGEWRDAGTVHLLPQQIPDMVLALQKSHEFLRMGMRQRRKQATQQNGGLEPLDDQNGSPSKLSETVGEPATNSEQSQGSFVEKVASGRGAKRTR